jgi:hypothetical protein
MAAVVNNVSECAWGMASKELVSQADCSRVTTKAVPWSQWMPTYQKLMYFL